jgi:hypothetical protein
MQILLLLAILTCAACVVAGLLVPALRPLAVSGSAALLFLVCLFGWWALIYLGVWPTLPRGPLGFFLIIIPPLLPAAALVYLLKRRGGAA